jgi:hypothetical protein
MGLLLQIILGIVIFIIVYYIYTWFTSGATVLLSSLRPGNSPLTLTPNTLPGSGNTNNYTYSLWFYVNDWNYRFGEAKTILQRQDSTGMASPLITLGPMQNNLTTQVACYPNQRSKGAAQTFNCVVDNIPIQRWVNVTISVNGRTMDTYMNGKLVRTCVLPGVVKTNGTAPINITPDGGFSGWTSNIRYYAYSINPQQAWNIYTDGYGGSILGNIFNKYRIKVSFLEDNVTRGSFEL